MSAFADFLRTGVLGCCVAGAEESAIVGVLGPPEDVGVRRRDGLIAYRNHSFQLFFQDGKLRGFGLYFDASFETQVPPPLVLDIPWTHRTTKPEALTALREWGLPTSEEPGLGHLISPSPSVGIGFYDDESLAKIIATPTR